eukprot:3041997-Amphidinium_carterae.1
MGMCISLASSKHACKSTFISCMPTQLIARILETDLDLPLQMTTRLSTRALKIIIVKCKSKLASKCLVR